jgi:hypothetical protein
MVGHLRLKITDGLTRKELTMNARAEMLGKLVSRLAMIESRCEPDELRVLQDLLEKLYNDFVQHDWQSLTRYSPWHAELKRFCRKEPCWVSLDLLYQESELKRFLWITKMIYSLPSYWTLLDLMEAVRNSSGGKENAEMTRDQVWRVVTQLDALGVTCLLADGSSRRVIMRSGQFQKTFCVRLPR